MRLVCISDTHSLQHNLLHSIPDGDVLLHAGDIMNCGYRVNEIRDFLSWFQKFPHKHKIFIAGNHDRYFENYPVDVRTLLKEFDDVIYLQDSSVVLDGIKFYGSAWTPFFCNWAFNVARGQEIKKVWDKIPEDTDVLMTHGPPYGYLDQVNKGPYLGCEELAKRVLEVKPLCHVFGHIHDGYGTRVEHGVSFINASCCTERYQPINKPIIIDL